MLVLGRSAGNHAGVEDDRSRNATAKLPHLPVSTWSTVHLLVEDVLHHDVLDDHQELLCLAAHCHLGTKPGAQAAHRLTGLFQSLFQVWFCTPRIGCLTAMSTHSMKFM